MSNIDWSKAPEGTTHTDRTNTVWFKFEPDGTCWYATSSGDWLRNGCALSDYAPGELIERPSEIREMLVESRYPSRDDFALAAMQAMLTRHPSNSPKLTAMEAYALADAMLAERAK